MSKKSDSGIGMQALVNHYRRIFRVPENIYYYSGEDYKKAERKFVKFAIYHGDAGSLNSK